MSWYEEITWCDSCGVEITCAEPVPLNDDLIAAVVDPKARRIAESLQMGGMITFRGRFERNRPDDPLVHRRVQITLHNCSMQYERFPYPLSQSWVNRS